MRYVSSCGCTCPLSLSRNCIYIYPRNRFTLSRQSNKKTLSQPLLKSVAFESNLFSPLLTLSYFSLDYRSIFPLTPLNPPDKKKKTRSLVNPPPYFSFLYFHHRQIVHTTGYYISIASRETVSFFFLVVSFLEIEIPAFAPCKWRPTNHIYTYLFYCFRVRARCISVFVLHACVFSCTMQAFVRAPIYRVFLRCDVCVYVCVCVHMCIYMFMCVYVCVCGCMRSRTRLENKLCVLHSLVFVSFFSFFFFTKMAVIGHSQWLYQ